MAFFLTLGCLVETFMIRPFVVPPMTVLVGRIHPEANWWPGALSSWSAFPKALRNSRR